jgi:hypothetical protein
VANTYAQAEPQLLLIKKTVWESDIATQIKNHRLSQTVVSIIRNDLSRPIFTFWNALQQKFHATITERDMKEIQAGSLEWEKQWNEFKERIPGYVDQVKGVWHQQSVLFVDVYVPKGTHYLVQGYSFVTKYVSIAARETRRQVLGVYGIIVDTMQDYVEIVPTLPMYKSLMAHPIVVQAKFWYQDHAAEYVQILLHYLWMILSYLLDVLDFAWMILEGRVSLFKQLESDFQFLMGLVMDQINKK